MPRNKIFQKENSNLTILSRQQIKSILMNKYYSLYMNNYEIEGVDYQAKEFILKRLWADGSIACFIMPNTKGSSKFPAGQPVFCPFAPGYWNIYDWPTKVSLIRLRGATYIPVGLQEVDKDVVIGYAQRNRKPVSLIVNSYIERMTNVLMTIKTNLKVHKMPWLIAGTPEDEAKLKNLFNLLDQDEPKLYIDSDDADKLKALVSGAPYIIDKLWSHYQCIENELREFLGFGNLGISEKKEHLINSEVASNNAIIEANKSCLLDCVSEMFERVGEYLGPQITIRVKEYKVEIPEVEEDFQEEEEE